MIFSTDNKWPAAVSVRRARDVAKLRYYIINFPNGFSSGFTGRRHRRRRRVVVGRNADWTATFEVSQEVITSRISRGLPAKTVGMARMEATSSLYFEYVAAKICAYTPRDNIYSRVANSLRNL